LHDAFDFFFWPDKNGIRSVLRWLADNNGMPIATATLHVDRGSEVVAGTPEITKLACPALHVDRIDMH